MEKIAILHVLWGGGIGGTEEYVSSLISNFDHNKFDIRLCIVSKKGQIFDELIKRGIPFFYIGMRNGYDILGAFRYYIVLRKGAYSIIHLHTANLLVTLFSLIYWTAAIFYTEHVGPGAPQCFNKKRLFYLLFKKTRINLIAISGFVKSSMVNEMRARVSKISVVYNGIDGDKFNCASGVAAPDLITFKGKYRFLMGFIGRVEKYKRPDLFVRVAKLLLKKEDNMQFVIVGDGSALCETKLLVQNIGLESRFFFTGFRRDIGNILKTFDLLFFPSSGEGFGIVPVEAMACGVPVFAFNEGAMTELIQDKINGFLLESLDSEEISDSILKYMNDKELLDKVKRNASVKVKNELSLRISARKLEKLYESVLEK